MILPNKYTQHVEKDLLTNYKNSEDIEDVIRD